mmetsp:Transcript_21256/g.62059  ORF Transcript_21256/g.62059 Transcript_21256/m.62059 type:complete len:217 (-) Transcript_21256:864-1514(-)
MTVRCRPPGAGTCARTMSRGGSLKSTVTRGEGRNASRTVVPFSVASAASRSKAATWLRGIFQILTLFTPRRSMPGSSTWQASAGSSDPFGARAKPATSTSSGISREAFRRKPRVVDRNSTKIGDRSVPPCGEGWVCCEEVPPGWSDSSFGAGRTNVMILGRVGCLINTRASATLLLLRFTSSTPTRKAPASGPKSFSSSCTGRTACPPSTGPEKRT